MHRLSAADLAAVVDFIHVASDEAGPAAFPVHVVERLRALVSCEWGSYCELDRRRRRGLLLVESPVPDWTLSPDTFWRLAGEHALCRAQRHGRFDALKLSDFLNRTALHRLEVYADWLRPYGFEFELTAAIPSSPDHTKTFIFDDGRHDFGERERALLNLLLPHLSQLHRAAAVRRQADHARALVEADLDRGEHAVVLIDTHGAVEIASDRARHLLGRYCAEWTGAHLPAAIIEWLDARSRAGPGGRVPASLEISGPAGTLRVECAGARDDGVLMLEELAAGQNPAALSAREREVLALVGDGMRNREIAEALWISPATVRKHLEHIYEKLDVHTRTGAVAESRRSS